MLFFESGPNDFMQKRIFFLTLISATYCFVMNERLFPMEKKPDRVRIVSNILYEEVKKHKDNRHLNYVFDNDFVSKQQEQGYATLLCTVVAYL